MGGPDPIRTTVEYAIDDNDAEKARNSNPAAEKRGPGKELPKKNSKFRTDAKIWQVYLKEAEEKAKEKVASWNTGLDSLLIFAGLFAGVVSSFVIDARNDMQSDGQPRLLAGILNMLRDGSVGDIFGTSSSAYWINGLWIVSLFTTLFGAIMGVLAKAWLAKYSPVTTRQKAEDAYDRYKLDKQAERWHLKEVLILVPLLVQVASVLFLIGLIIQIYGDSPTIGRALLSFCIVGGLVYFSMTLFPLLIPSSPFNTPVSELFEALFGKNPGGRSAFETDMDEGLREILYTKLIQSPNPDHIDEAVAELARPTFADWCTKFLCKNETPEILLSRFQELAAVRNVTPQRDEPLSNYLLAFLSFVGVYEIRLLEAYKNQESFQGYKTLNKVLCESMEPGNPLHRWNDLPEDLRPLLFALRTNILVLLGPKDGNMPSGSNTNELPLGPEDSNTTPTFPSDFNANELPDRPWEMAFREIRSTHRIHFTLGACRGLVEGRDGSHLKAISCYILSLCLAKASLTASETGRTSEWASKIDEKGRRDVDATAVSFISKLYGATIAGWEAMVVDALKETLSIDLPRNLGNKESTRGDRVLRCLIFSLSQPSRALRVHAIKMLKLVASPDCTLLNYRKGAVAIQDDLAAIVGENLDTSIDTIVTMTIYDDRGVRDDGLELLILLVKANDPMGKSIRSALVVSMRSGLSQYEDEPRISTTVKFIEKLSKLQDSDDLFTSSIKEVVPDLIDLSLNDHCPKHVRQAALKLSQRLWSIKKLREIKSAIINHLGTVLRGEEFSDRYDLLNDFQVLLEPEIFAAGEEGLLYTFPWDSAAAFIDDIMASAVFGDIVKIAIRGKVISTGAQEFLKLLAKGSRLDRHWPEAETIAACLDAVTERPSSWRVQRNAVLVMEIFSKQLTVTTGLLQILVNTALMDDDNDVRSASLRLVADLWKFPGSVSSDMAQEVKNIIISGAHKNTIQNEPYPNIQEDWVRFLGEIAKRVTFSEAIPIIVEVATMGRVSSDFKSKAIALLASEDFTKESSYCEVVKKSIPTDLIGERPVAESGWVSKSKWVKLLAELLPLPEIHDIAKGALAEVVSSIREALNPAPEHEKDLEPAKYDNGGEASYESRDDYSSDEDSSDDDVMTELDIAPPLRRLLRGFSWMERVYWVEMLGILANHFPVDFPNASKTVLQMAMYDPDYDVRSTALQSLRPLLEQDTTRDSLLTTVIEHLDRMAGDRDWDVRFALVKLLASFGASEKCKLPGQVTDKLIAMALEDGDYDVRSESVNSLAVLATNQIQYPGFSKIVLEKFEDGNRGGHSIPRIPWMRFIAPHIQDASSPHTNLVFEIAITDEDVDARNAAVAILEQLLSNTELRGAMASKVGKLFADQLQQGSHRSTMLSLLSKLTMPKPATGGTAVTVDPEDPLSPGHDVWIGVTMLLGQNSFSGVPAIIEKAIKDASRGKPIFNKSLFQGAKLLDPIQTHLPQYLESALKSDASEVRSEAVALFDRLLCSESRNHAPSMDREIYELPAPFPDYAELLSRTNDAQLIIRLSELTVKDSSYDLRKRSLKLLKGLFSNARFQDFIKSSLSKVLESCFKEPDLVRFQRAAIDVLHSLTRANPNEDCDTYRAIVSPSIPHLVKVTLSTDSDHEDMRKEAERILLENIASYSTKTRLTQEVLSAIPAMIPTITGEGKRLALQLGDTLQLTDNAVGSIAHALAQGLRAGSSFSRATAIELLAKLYSRHLLPEPRLVESAIPEIIALALDEKDDAAGIRTTAVQLLSVLLTQPMKPANEDSPAPFPVDSPVMKRVKPLATRFMGLLQDGNLRSSVIELLSLMSVDVTVRRTISLQIIGLAFGPDSEFLQWQCELLARLISDGRFDNEPIDKVMLFVTSAMITRPRLAPYRFEILTSLWCRYGSHSIVPARQGQLDNSIPKQPNDLVDWFTFALFGRHATVREVQKWLEKGKIWLANENTGSESSPPPPLQPKQTLEAHIVPAEEGVAAKASSIGSKDSTTQPEGDCAI